MELTLSDRTITLPDSLGDLKPIQYMNFFSIVAKLPVTEEELRELLSTFQGEMIMIELSKIMIDGDIDDVLIEDLHLLSAYIFNLITKNDMDLLVPKSFKIDDIEYAVTDMDKIKTGEYISIKICQEQHKNNPIDYINDVCSILCRPCSHVMNVETGEDMIVISKFDEHQMSMIKQRSDIFKNKGKARDIVPVLNFFLSMKKR